jgi:predicted NAD-dependent protein-ADP-ribosyltransferase YbiA (DUF1768 family)
MGGPCRLVSETGKTTTAPECTNNFQIRPFVYRNNKFYSCEQAYQAFKFNEGSDGFKKVIAMIPKNDSVEEGSRHGNAVWWVGQQNEGDLNRNLDNIKIRTMLNANRAKYDQNDDLKEELLSTGSLIIVGGPSTSWTYKSKSHNWSYWNGRIQMIIREELRPADKRNNELLSQLLQEIDSYEA